MRPFRCPMIGLLLIAAGFSLPAGADTWYFEYAGVVDGSDRPGAPNGSILTGVIAWDPDAVRRSGMTNYFPDRGTASMSAIGSEGFALTMELRVMVVTPGPENDTMTMQSFQSESPNDWHMVFDLIEPGGDDGWLQGDSSLPAAFPEVLDDAFYSIYFTDEYEWVRVIEGRFISIARVAAPDEFAAPVTVVEKDGNVATAIRDLPLGDNVYDVTFPGKPADKQYGEPGQFDFPSADAALAARNAVVAILNREGGIVGVGRDKPAGRPAFRIPYARTDAILPAPLAEGDSAVHRVLAWEGIAGEAARWAAPGTPGLHALKDNGRWARFDVVGDTRGAANLPPQVDTGGPYSGIVGVPLQFDASNSTDTDGSVVAYAWDFGDGAPAGSGPFPVHTFVAAGTRSVLLTVKDDDGAVSTEEIVVSVGLGSMPPIADPGGPYRGVVGVPVRFDGSGSDDAEGGLQTWEWDFGDGSPLRKGRRKEHRYGLPGRYPVTLRVIDAGGDADLAVTWADIGTGRAVPHADAGGPYRGTAGSELQFNAGASVGSGAISYEWNFGDTSEVESGRKPRHVYARAGTYSVTLTIVDENGAADSDVATVVID